jgi:hypothetical protein
MRLVRKFIFLILPLLLISSLLAAHFSPTLAAWKFDSEVTEVGRHAERARQLLYWVMTHPTDYTNPGISVLWQAVRNFVYLAYVLIIILVGVSTMVFRGRWIPIGVGLVAWGEEKLGKWIPRLVGLILFATFSYLITVALANLADLLMGFFIRHYGGCDLFNIKFAGPGSSCDFSLDALKAMEQNYSFIGYREMSAVNNEAANTALFLVRLTTFTYNFLSIMLLLRHVILWFLIIVSPLIALLFPFVLIRNVAWIWIGEFLRWLFYGPLVAIFLAGLVQIWKFTIPYGFDFSRTHPPSGQPAVVFPTAISILIGGPAQGASLSLGSLNPSAPISGTNSLNYVDTYAEYVISLIMLWVMILLPFLLLRIFRDYCCEIFGARQDTLWAMYDKLKSWGQPPGGPPPSGPGPGDRPKKAGPTGQLHVDLPYKQLKSLPQAVTRKQIEQIAQAKTEDIIRQLGLAVPSMREIALADMNMQRRQMMKRSLDALANPASMTSSSQQDRYQKIRQELQRRAAEGDLQAKRLLSIAGGRAAPAMMKKGAGRGVLSDQQRLAQVQKEIREKKLPIRMPVSTKMTAAEKLERIEKEAKEKNIPLVIRPRQAPAAAQLGKTTRPPSIPAPGKPVTVPVKLEEYEEVKEMWVNHYRLSEVPVSEKIKSRRAWLEHDVKTIQNAIDKISSVVPDIKKEGFDEVAGILPFLLLGEFSEEQTLAYLKAKLSAAKQVLKELLAEEKIKEQFEKEAEKEEEETVEVPVETGEKEKQAAELSRKLARELPSESDEKKPGAAEEAVAAKPPGPAAGKSAGSQASPGASDKDKDGGKLK